MNDYTKSLYRAIAQWLNKNGPFKDYKTIQRIIWQEESMHIIYISKNDKMCDAYLRCSREEMMRKLTNDS